MMSRVQLSLLAELYHAVICLYICTSSSRSSDSMECGYSGGSLLVVEFMCCTVLHNADEVFGGGPTCMCRQAGRQGMYITMHQL